MVQGHRCMFFVLTHCRPSPKREGTNIHPSLQSSKGVEPGHSAGCKPKKLSGPRPGARLGERFSDFPARFSSFFDHCLLVVRILGLIRRRERRRQSRESASRRIQQSKEMAEAFCSKADFSRPTGTLLESADCDYISYLTAGHPYIFDQNIPDSEIRG